MVDRPWNWRVREQTFSAALGLHPLDRLRIDLVRAALGDAGVLVRPLARHGALDAAGHHHRPPVVVPTGTLMDGAASVRGGLSGLVLAAAQGSAVAGVGLAAAPPARAVDRVLARRLAVHARLLVLRSEAAAHRLALAGVHSPIRVGADMAWLQPTMDTGPLRADELLVVGEPADRFVAAALAGSLPAVADDGLRLALGHWQVARDGGAHLAAALARRLPVSNLEVLETWPDAGAAMRAAAGCLAILALDVDAQLIAALTRTPAVVLSDDEESLALADHLGQPAFPPAVSGSRLRRIVAETATRPWEGGEAVERLRQRARESAGLLRLVVSASGPPSGGGSAELPSLESQVTLAGGGLLLWPEPAAT